MNCSRFLFCADRGLFGSRSERHPPMIAKAYMDGTNFKLLVSDVFAPAALAIDAVKRLLYWSDAHLDAVSCVEYTGLHRYMHKCTCIVAACAGVHERNSLHVGSILARMW